MAARKSGITFAARSASFIMVPRPGPSSTRWSVSGDPIPRQTAAVHRPINSPNIWLISGAVMKSPARAERVARGVVAVLGMGEAKLHVLRDRHRAGDRDAPADLLLERGHRRPS